MCSSYSNWKKCRHLQAHTNRHTNEEDCFRAIFVSRALSLSLYRSFSCVRCALVPSETYRRTSRNMMSTKKQKVATTTKKNISIMRCAKAQAHVAGQNWHMQAIRTSRPATLPLRTAVHRPNLFREYTKAKKSFGTKQTIVLNSVANPPMLQIRKSLPAPLSINTSSLLLCIWRTRSPDIWGLVHWNTFRWPE